MVGRDADTVCGAGRVAIEGDGQGGATAVPAAAAAGSCQGRAGQQGRGQRTQRIWLCPIVDPGAPALAFDESGRSQHLEVVGDRRSGHLEGAGQLTDTRLSPGVAGDQTQQPQSHGSPSALNRRAISVDCSTVNGSRVSGEHHATVAAWSHCLDTALS